ncbi:MAG TPA: hypothetical protein VK447_18390 [Myxococcaceae bacterium]|nr:hypothetical protein [Myxococcaceae bacterium]
MFDVRASRAQTQHAASAWSVDASALLGLLALAARPGAVKEPASAEVRHPFPLPP